MPKATGTGQRSSSQMRARSARREGARRGYEHNSSHDGVKFSQSRADQRGNNSAYNNYQSKAIEDFFDKPSFDIALLEKGSVNFTEFIEGGEATPWKVIVKRC